MYRKSLCFDVAFYVLRCKPWLGVNRTKRRAGAAAQNAFRITHHGHSFRVVASRSDRTWAMNVHHFRDEGEGRIKQKLLLL